MAEVRIHDPESELCRDFGSSTSALTRSSRSTALGTRQRHLFDQQVRGAGAAVEPEIVSHHLHALEHRERIRRQRHIRHRLAEC